MPAACWSQLLFPLRLIAESNQPCNLVLQKTWIIMSYMLGKLILNISFLLVFSSLWLQCNISEWHYILPRISRWIPKFKRLYVAYYCTPGPRNLYQFHLTPDRTCEWLHCRLVCEHLLTCRQKLVNLFLFLPCVPLTNKAALLAEIAFHRNSWWKAAIKHALVPSSTQTLPAHIVTALATQWSS